MKKPRPRPRNREPKARIRGTVSTPCPKCKRPSRVFKTRLHEGATIRQRICVRSHRFTTKEIPQNVT